MEDNLLGHLLKANDPAAQREVEQRLADDPAAIHELAVLRRALAPLAADGDDVDPPADLWVRALGRVAEFVVATDGPVGRDDDGRTSDFIRKAAATVVVPTPVLVGPALTPAPLPADGGLPPARRWNVVAAVGLSLSFLALVVPAILHMRERSHQVACEDSMREFYVAAAGYSDQHDGNFPRVPAGQPAATAADTLKQAGYLSPDVRFACPSAPPDATAPVALANYAYTLGFVEGGELKGPSRRDGPLPILADAPTRRDGLALPVNHRRGQNVLFADGHMRFCTTTTVGVEGDDIFCNKAGEVSAGFYRIDTVLGRPEERP